VSEIDRKALAREYKEAERPMGVYRVRSGASGKSLVGTSVNVSGMLNRMRFELDGGAHPNEELQADWTALGADAFEFEMIDQLEPRQDPGDDPAEDLELLGQMWTDKLAASGESLY
jgi:hypothetical protein